MLHDKAAPGSVAGAGCEGGHDEQIDDALLHPTITAFQARRCSGRSEARPLAPFESRAADIWEASVRPLFEAALDAHPDNRAFRREQVRLQTFRHRGKRRNQIHGIAAPRTFVHLHPMRTRIEPRALFLNVPIKGVKRDTLHLIEEEFSGAHSRLPQTNPGADREGAMRAEGSI
jgi:hypothetical protein